MYRRMQRFLLWGPGAALTSIVLWTAVLIAGVSDDLAVDDPLLKSMYVTFQLQGHPSPAPLPPLQERENLQLLIEQAPDRSDLYRQLADVEVQLLRFDEAESTMRKYLEKSTDPRRAYEDLAAFYHSRLEFEKELQALNEQANALTPGDDDIQNGVGRYALYHRVLGLIQRYGLPENPDDYYRKIIESYPDQEDSYLEFVEHLKDRNRDSASEILEQFHIRFPDEDLTYLQTRASLLEPADAFALLNEAYDPLWNLDLVRALDNYARTSGQQTEYVRELQNRMRDHPEDFETASRIFYAFYLQGDLLEAHNVLNDFRVQKEKRVSENHDKWQTSELYGMARLSELILQHNDAARFYYSLYARLKYEPDSTLFPDDALFGIYRILLAAGNRPVQIGAGNLDYYRDIAELDSHPGILNGILSLILNDTDPAEEFRQQQEKALGYFNRAEALRLLRFTQRFYPDSRHLPEMYTQSLQVYQQYGMDHLIIKAGEEFMRRFPADSDQVLSAGIQVADACSRLKQHEKEWETYQSLLPVAAINTRGPLLPDRSTSRSNYDEYYDSDENTPQGRTLKRRKPEQQTTVSYDSLLNRYIASLAGQKNYLEIIRTYKVEIDAHPSEEGLYERLAAYLEQNRLFEEEQAAYRQAIQRFQGMSWYEKLARFYLRQRREKELEELTLEVLQLFKGSEVENYFDHVLKGTSNIQQLNVSLNLHAHNRFPLNIAFARNLLRHYQSVKAWEQWEALAAHYYFLDESIRNQYLARMARTGRMPASEKIDAASTNTVEARFVADTYVWNSHFEEAIPILEELTRDYSSDAPLNLLLADLKRSLGRRNPENQRKSAQIRERLARIRPTNASLWITAGETMAEVEEYQTAREYWNQILKSDPLDPDSYLDVATIEWDYYLFDEALSTIEMIRKLRHDPTLMAFEVGAIHESAGQPEKAIEEYSANLFSESARNRLSELYQREKWKMKIQTVLEQQLSAHLQDDSVWLGIIRFYSTERETDLAREHIQRAIETLSSEPFRNLMVSLYQIARDSRFKELQESILLRQIDEASSEPERLQRTVELARFYEGQKETQQAERTYLVLYRQNPRSAGLIEELASFYKRAKQYEKRAALYQEVLPHTNLNFRKQFLQELSANFRQAGDLDRSLEVARQLLALDPLHAPYFQKVGEILAEQNDYPALTEHYQTGLETIRNSKLNDEEKKTRTAEYRRGMIEADSILQDFTSALDQFIEIINRDAENEELLRETTLFAVKHNLTNRLTNYYERTAATSPKDHRWPLILGRIELFRGDFESAVSHFLAAIEVRPERIDLRELLADSYRRLGSYEEAIQVYEQLYILTFKDKKWNAAAAELRARLGAKKEALELFSSTLNQMSPFEKEFALCRKAVEWGWPDEAVRRGRNATKLYLKDLSLPLDSDNLASYVEAILQSGNRPEAFSSLSSLLDQVEQALRSATFNAEQLRSSRYILTEMLSSQFPRLVAKYFTGEDFETLETQILASLQGKNDGEVTSMIQSRYLRMVRAASMGPAEEKLLRRLNENAFRAFTSQGDSARSQYRNRRSELRDFYMKRHAFQECANFLKVEWQRNQRKNSYYGDLIEIAEAYRLAALQDREIETLQEYYSYGVKYRLETTPVERYLDLLNALNRKGEIRNAAVAANLISANYFIRRQDTENSKIAIESLYSRNRQTLQPVWKTVNQAMLGWQFRQKQAETKELFTVALDLYPVGTLLQQKVDSPSSLEGDLWFFFASRYGEYLWWIEDHGQAPFYLVSDLEGAPTSATRQSSIASFYSQQKKFDTALNHAKLSRQLDTANLQWMDLEARILAQMGRKEEAVDLWRSMLDVVSTNHAASVWRFIIPASDEFSFFPGIQEKAVEFLKSKVSRTGEAGIFDILSGYLKALDLHNQKEAIRMLIPLAPAPASFGNSLLNYHLPKETEIVIFETVSDYWSGRLLEAGGRERESIWNQWIRWTHRFVITLLEFGESGRALNALESLRKDMQDEEVSETRKEETQILYIRVLLRGGSIEKATLELNHFTEGLPLSQNSRGDHLQKAFRLLDEEGFSELARGYRQQFYEEQLAKGQDVQSSYNGLANILLEKKKLQEAKALLKSMMFRYGEDISAIEAAAELMEANKLFEDAIIYRQDINRREPWNYRNMTRLSEDLLTTGKSNESIALARKVLITNTADARDRARCAELLAAFSTDSSESPREFRRILSLHRENSEPGSAPYDHLYRQTLMKEAPDQLDLLKGELFLFPDESDLQKKIFEIYVQNKQYDQALEMADPRYERKESYYKREEYSGFRDLDEEEWEYDYSYFREYSIERWKLKDEETVQLALQAAECAERLGDPQGQIFFLKMARFHSTTRDGRARIDLQMEAAEHQMQEEQQEENQRFKIQMNLERAS